MRLETPVIFIFFNRPDTTMEVLRIIRKVQPTRLYLVSDGAREGRKEEVEVVADLRAQVENFIDWECDVRKNYAEKNMGCGKRMYSGISWVFEQEEQAIILEDDIIPVDTFFIYCQELLKKYRDIENVFYISGNNIYQSYPIDDSYTFTKFPSIWGWATWKRAWSQYMGNLEDWRIIKASGKIEEYYGRKWAKFYIPQIECAYTGERDTWDYQWEATRIFHDGIGIVPGKNMIENIGFEREDATHTQGSSIYDFTKYDMKFPMCHPISYKVNNGYDKGYVSHVIAKEFERWYFMGKIKRRLRMFCQTLYHRHS